jgi:hypothetical protein
MSADMFLGSKRLASYNMAHIGGFMTLLGAMAVGASLVMMSDPQSEWLFQMIDHYKVTLFFSPNFRFLLLQMAWGPVLFTRTHMHRIIDPDPGSFLKRRFLKRCFRLACHFVETTLR